MNDLIVKKIRVTEELIVRCKIKEKEDSKNKYFWFGCRLAYEDTLKKLKEILREYEENVQSIEESMRFLRGE